MRRPSLPRNAPDLEAVDRGPAHRRQLFDETWRPGAFDFERLDAHRIARDALCAGMSIARRLPEAQHELRSRLQATLVEALGGTAAIASLSGEARQVRAQTARASAAEAAALLDAAMLLGVAKPDDVSATVLLLGRLCAMLSRLAVHISRAR